VIPVLTDGAQMPTEAELPGELAVLGRCQYRRLQHHDATADLGRLVAELANLDAGLGTAAAARPSSREGWPVPNQLPAAARYFTGRQQELTRLVQPAQDATRTVVISAVDGMAGIGKTALVVLAGHRLTDSGRYPGGTLLVDLHGYSGLPPTDPAVALEILLRGLGVPGPQIPADVDARVGLYRSVTAGRQVLIVLDNAREEEQVRPLLPGGRGSLVLITSRRRLSGLDEADHLYLDTLPPHEAAWLFRVVAGTDRDPGGERTVEAIVELCGYLPLAVRIAAARLRTDRSRTLTSASLLTQLQTEQASDRLAALAEGDRSVAAAFAISYRHLSAKQRRAFAALGLHPGQDYEPYATAALLNTQPANAGRLLHALEQVHLLDQPTSGRYRFHDLIRAYATTLARTRPDAQQRAALDRLYNYYANTTSHAATLTYPYDSGQLPLPPQAATPALQLSDPATAEAWLEAELANLLAVATHATAQSPEHTTHQSATLHRCLYLRGHYTDAYDLHQHALIAAQAIDDSTAQITALNSLGRIDHMQGRYDPATDCFTRALQTASAIGGNHHGEITALNRLGEVHLAQGRYGQATDCHSRALQVARATGNRIGEIEALNGLGWVHHVQGRYGAATDCMTGSLETARATGNRGGELDALLGLGHIHYAHGRYDPAADCFRQVLDLASENDNRNYQREAHLALGRSHHATGHPHQALAAYQRALALARDLNQPTDQARAHDGLAHTYDTLGQHHQARNHLQQALNILATFDNPNAEDLTADDIRAHLTRLQPHPQPST
jgi:tetratricopeptide (TPR) repeat protein